MKRRVWPVLLAAGVGLAILLSLGIWQTQRLAWKENRLEKIEDSLSAPPIPFDEATAPGRDPDYTKVRATGRFTGKVLHRVVAVKGGPGRDVLQVFSTAEGAPLLVLRGQVSENQPTPDNQGALTINGVLRQHVGTRGYFDPDNDVAANQWYWWDLPAMYQASAGAATGKEAWVLQLLPGSPGTEGLLVTPPNANLRNNHLGYAITWFGLAAVLAVMTGVFVWRERLRR